MSGRAASRASGTGTALSKPSAVRCTAGRGVAVDRFASEFGPPCFCRHGRSPGPPGLVGAEVAAAPASLLSENHRNGSRLGTPLLGRGRNHAAASQSAQSNILVRSALAASRHSLGGERSSLLGVVKTAPWSAVGGSDKSLCTFDPPATMGSSVRTLFGTVRLASGMFDKSSPAAIPGRSGRLDPTCLLSSLRCSRR